MWIDDYTEFRVGGISNPEEIYSSGMPNVTGHVKTLGKDVCRNGVRSFVSVWCAFPDGYCVPSGDHNEG
jgi:hypothetical protein